MAKRRRTKRQNQRVNRAFALMNEINKKHDDPILFRLGEKYKTKEPRVSIGIPTLDKILSGGFPMRGFVELFGKESSGKTHIACLLAKQFQRRGHDVLYIDAENSMDVDHVRSLGVDVDALYYSQESGLETVMQLIKDSVMSNYAPGLIIVDSVAALSPEVEDIDSKDIALVARHMSKATRVLNGVNKNTLIIFINQIRKNINSMYSGEITSGGHAMLHWALVRLSVRRGKDISRTEAPQYKKHLGKSRGDVVGHHINIKVIKNKTAVPFGTTRLFYYIDGKIDVYDDLISYGLERGTITRGGSWFTIGGERFQGRPKLVDAMREDKSIVSEVLGRG